MRNFKCIRNPSLTEKGIFRTRRLLKFKQSQRKKTVKRKELIAREVTSKMEKKTSKCQTKEEE